MAFARKSLNKADEFYIFNHLGETLEQLSKDINVEQSAIEKYLDEVKRTGVRKEIEENNIVDTAPKPEDTAFYKMFGRVPNATILTGAASTMGDMLDKQNSGPTFDPTAVTKVRK